MDWLTTGWKTKWIMEKDYYIKFVIGDIDRERLEVLVWHRESGGGGDAMWHGTGPGCIQEAPAH